MLGKLFEIINEYKQDMSSAADNKEAYDRYQRFFKSPPYESTSVSDFCTKLPFIGIRGRLGGCIRNLRDKVEKRYAKVPRYLSGLRKDKRNGN